MAAARVALGRDFAGQQRVPVPHHADMLVMKQHLSADLRRRGAEHADLQIDRPLPQRPRILVGFGCEAQADMRRGLRRSRPTTGAARNSRNASLARMVKVSVEGADLDAARRCGRSTARASRVSAWTGSRNAMARGVGTSPRPARTRSGSPVAARSLSASGSSPTRSSRGGAPPRSRCPRPAAHPARPAGSGRHPWRRSRQCPRQ